MAFPTSPTDGQIHNGFKYNAAVGAWDKTNFVSSALAGINGRSVEFLNNTKLQFGRTADSASWPVMQNLHDTIDPAPAYITAGARGSYYVTAGSSSVGPTTEQIKIEWKHGSSANNLASNSSAHWAAIGGN